MSGPAIEAGGVGPPILTPPRRHTGTTTQLRGLGDKGDQRRFRTDDRYRWLLHRLWIAAGNEAYAYATAIGRPVHFALPWG